MSLDEDFNDFAKTLVPQAPKVAVEQGVVTSRTWGFPEITKKKTRPESPQIIQGVACASGTSSYDFPAGDPDPTVTFDYSVDLDSVDFFAVRRSDWWRMYLTEFGPHVTFMAYGLISGAGAFTYVYNDFTQGPSPWTEISGSFNTGTHVFHLIYDGTEEESFPESTLFIEYGCGTPPWA
jgi:hypothetical protein